MSALSLAISTAVSTEMPMSDCRNAEVSLMPSPRKPTVCPCFVGAEDIHRAETLDSVQVFDNRFLSRHLHGALCQIGRNNHWQHFGRKPYGYGNCKNKRIKPVALGKTVD